MSFFRSERMAYCQLVVHQETAFDCFVELGYLGKVQFVNEYDDDYVPNLKYVTEVQRCAEVERVIFRLQDEVNKSGLKTLYYPNVDQNEIPKSQDLPDIEASLQQLDVELTEVLRHCDAMLAKRFTLIEQREVLSRAHEFLKQSSSQASLQASDSLMAEILHDSSREESGRGGDKFGPLNLITAAIPRERFPAFERMVWRVSRGNAYVKHAEFELNSDAMKHSGQTRLKYAVLILFSAKGLGEKLTKICQGFQAKIYACPESETKRLETLSRLTNELEDLQEVFAKTCEHKRRVLNAALPYLYIWRSKIRKCHAVYMMLNQLGTVRELRNQNQKYLQAECWIPRRDLNDIRHALQRGARRTTRGDPLTVFPPILQEVGPARGRPPTYFALNKFTYGFQKLIDAYGIATYQELNPAPYTIITFPFLFAVMFGDIGHGILLFMFAASMILREKTIERKQKESLKTNEIAIILYGGRYIILLMGIFSIYTGFIYNDLLSKSLNIFGSSWRVHFDREVVLNNPKMILDPTDKEDFRGIPYIFGLDPVWAVADNNIILTNSVKMKMAIILGVFQMIFGLVLSAWNAIYFKHKTDFYLVFLPQIIFLCCLFLYLVILVFYKWTWFGGQQPDEYGPGCSPSILISFINMMLLKPPDPAPEGCVEGFYEGEAIVEKVLLFTALAVVPVLLVGKPLHCMYEHRKMKAIADKDEQASVRRSTITKIRKSLIYNVEYQTSNDFIAKNDPKEKLSEVWIHSGIHTIESVLGSISHTASYLRLWALSLAHSQLSDVLWNMVLGVSLKMNHGFLDSLVVFFCFGFFAILTLAILVLMEGLSAFLHTLRLHWVEFQSKFYGGAGEGFMPFRFEPSKKSDAAT